MHAESVQESPRRRIARRIGAAGLALATVLTLGACKATGGGYSRCAPGFRRHRRLHRRCKLRLQLHLRGGNGQEEDRDQGPDHLPRRPKQSLCAWATGLVDFPEIRIHGTVKPIFFLGVTECGRRWRSCSGRSCRDAPPEFEGIPAALFEGTYRSQDSTLSAPLAQGEFTVLVGDQGEPARPGGEFTGDLFAIDLYRW